jgi:hypothetical protein
MKIFWGVWGAATPPVPGAVVLFSLEEKYFCLDRLNFEFWLH